MVFNKEEYKSAKYEIIDLIKKTHDWENTEGFIADGVICPDIYENEKLKILVVLGESYGFDECEVVDIECQLEKDILGVGNTNTQTSKKIPILLWLLFESLEKNTKLKWDEFPNLLVSNSKNKELLQRTLLKIAWIEVKKASRNIENWGGDATRQNETEIYNSAFRNKEVLFKQVNSINPDLMIVCGDSAFNGLCDIELFGKEIQKGKKWQIQKNNIGQRIIHVSHPSYLKDWSYEEMYYTFELMFDSITNPNSLTSSS